MRSKYAMINIIKNKLRAAGQRDPMVMAVDACEENINEMKPAPADAPKIDPKDYPDETKVKPKKGAIPKPKGGVPNTERTPAIKGEMGQEYMKKVKKGIEASKKNQPKYNPYGKGATANPSNMSSTTGP